MRNPHTAKGKNALSARINCSSKTDTKLGALIRWTEVECVQVFGIGR
jgi:hypothetical protein